MFHYVSCNIFCVCVFLLLQSQHKVYCGLGEFGMSVMAMLGGGVLGLTTWGDLGRVMVSSTLSWLACDRIVPVSNCGETAHV